MSIFNTVPAELYAIAPTQFRPDTLELDASAIADNAARLGEAGIDKFLVTGSYGEFQSLSDDERVAAVQAVAASGAARSIMACAASTSTAATIALGHRMLDAGADLVMVAAPVLAEVNDADIIRHFEALGAGLERGIVVYNNPVFGIDLTPAQLTRIAQTPGITAIKQGTRSMPGLVESVASVRRASGGAVRTFAASDLTAHCALAAGVDGLTSTNAWVFPTAFLTMIECVRRGDGRGPHMLADALGAYAAVVRSYGQPRVVKAAMQLRGYAGSSAVRLPYQPLNSQEVAHVTQALEESRDMLNDALSAISIGAI